MLLMFEGQHFVCRGKPIALTLRLVASANSLTIVELKVELDTLGFLY